jgi:hypothetical protein
MYRSFGLLVCALGGFFLLSIPACEHDPFVMEPDPNDTMKVDTMIPIDTSLFCHPDTIYFQRDVLPIVLSSCGMELCHDAVNRQNGYEFTSYEKIVTSDAVVPGKQMESAFYLMMIATAPGELMPPSPRGPISDTNITVIRRWIEQGAKNLYCIGDSTCTIPAPVSFSQDIFPVIDKYCKGCHSGANPWAGLRLRNYNEVKVIVDNTLLLGVINHEPGFPEMPKTYGKLDSCIIAMITQWVDNGAPYN